MRLFHGVLPLSWRRALIRFKEWLAEPVFKPIISRCRMTLKEEVQAKLAALHAADAQATAAEQARQSKFQADVAEIEAIAAGLGAWADQEFTAAHAWLDAMMTKVRS